VKKIFTIVILTIVGHLGWTFASPPMKHYFLDAKIREIAKEGRLLNQGDMLKEIMRVVEEKKIPITEKDIKFKRDGNQMRISVEYSTTVTAPFYTKTYQFASNYSGVYEPR
jgi:hypothetical protein